MKRILILFAHPALEKSKVQRRLIKAVRQLDGVYVHDLYEHYPDFMIDIDHEQALLNDYDIILFQHPFYWYSSPSLLKEWQDLVLEYGFAYGSKGTALRGKVMASVISTGGPRSAYRASGHNLYTVRELLQPFEQVARFCGMRYLPPFVVHHTQYLTIKQIDQYAQQYVQLLVDLQQQIPSEYCLAEDQYLNEWQPQTKEV